MNKYNFIFIFCCVFICLLYIKIFSLDIFVFNFLSCIDFDFDQYLLIPMCDGISFNIVGYDGSPVVIMNIDNNNVIESTSQVRNNLQLPCISTKSRIYRGEPPVYGIFTYFNNLEHLPNSDILVRDSNGFSVLYTKEDWLRFSNMEKSWYKQADIGACSYVSNQANYFVWNRDEVTLYNTSVFHSDKIVESLRQSWNRDMKSHPADMDVEFLSDLKVKCNKRFHDEIYKKYR